MKSYKVQPSHLKGSIIVPTSKSQTMRAILFGSLAKGKSKISRYLPAPDTTHMINACRLLGAKIEVTEEGLEIDGVDGKIEKVEDVIQAGNSGIILRFITAISALSPQYTVITGDHSLRHQRPIEPLLNALKELGIFAESSRCDGFAPVIIKGPLKGGKTTIFGEDSQPVSSLLIACSFADESTEITVKNPGEKPWIALTLSWLDRFGMTYTHNNFENYWVKGRCRINGFAYTVPGDWSTALFPIAAALITGSTLSIDNLDKNDPQGDKEVLSVLEKMGAVFEMKENTLIVKSGSQLTGAVIDVNPFIDAIPILAVIACFAAGETKLINAAIARTKECDRLFCMTLELTKMGADIKEDKDSLIIKGKPLKGATLYSHHDHRIAMSLAVAALGAQGQSTIENVDCVSKTFPNFAESFQSIGASIA